MQYLRTLRDEISKLERAEVEKLEKVLAQYEASSPLVAKEFIEPLQDAVKERKKLLTKK